MHDMLTLQWRTSKVLARSLTFSYGVIKCFFFTKHFSEKTTIC